MLKDLIYLRKEKQPTIRFIVLLITIFLSFILLLFVVFFSSKGDAAIVNIPPFKSIIKIRIDELKDDRPVIIQSLSDHYKHINADIDSLYSYTLTLPFKIYCPIIGMFYALKDAIKAMNNHQDSKLVIVNFKLQNKLEYHYIVIKGIYQSIDRGINTTSEQKLLII